MPGNLYFFVNFWNIKIKKSKHSKNETIARPFLRDLEWSKAYIYQEAKGFSGFADDLINTCNRLYDPKVRAANESIGLIPKNHLIYVPAREYLQRYHKGNLGKPVYENEARNVIDIEGRGGGKSYFAAANIAHNFIFDGATDYDAYFEARRKKEPFTSETLIGAIDAKYSRDLISKFELGMSSLPGDIKYNDKLFPCPFLPTFQGTLNMPGRYIESVRETKVGNNWSYEGSRSKIHHRSFSDNEFAGNGTRPNLAYLEEVGFMGNLKGSLGALAECTANGSIKFGMIWMMGTGGDMDGGSTVAAKEVFYDPESYNCLVFEDVWENKGKIGYFVPASLTFNEFKDKEGYTDVPQAEAFLKKERATKAKAKSKRPLNDELQNRPLVPSEAFLVTVGNRFPIQELQQRQTALESNDIYVNSEYHGELLQQEDGSIKWTPNPLCKPIYNYPLSKDDSEEGAIVIYAHPYKDDDGMVNFGRYLAGNDPYDQSKAETESLGSLFIYDKLTKRIVAEYTGRPETYKHYYENARKLLKYYNARCLYENERKGFFDYLDYKNETHLLLDQPERMLMEVSPNTKVHRGKGMHMSAPIKEFGEELINTWLLDSAEDPENPTHLNLHKLRCIPLIKELIAYNEDGNFDRVMAFMMVMYHIQEMHKHLVEERKTIKTIQDDPFFNRMHYKKNGYKNVRFNN